MLPHVVLSSVQDFLSPWQLVLPSLELVTYALQNKNYLLTSRILPLTIVAGTHEGGRGPLLPTTIQPQPLSMEGPSWSHVLPVPHSPLLPAPPHSLKEPAGKVSVHGRDVSCHAFRTIETVRLHTQKFKVRTEVKTAGANFLTISRK